MTESVLWWQADPGRLLSERAEVHDQYPSFAVRLDGSGRVAFSGGLTATIVDVVAMRLRLTVRCPAGYPADAPRVLDDDAQIPADRRNSHFWHVNPDGSICFGDPQAWSPQYSIADLIAKIGDWMVNTLAVDAGILDRMPEVGVANLPGRQVVVA